MRSPATKIASSSRHDANRRRIEQERYQFPRCPSTLTHPNFTSKVYSLVQENPMFEAATALSTMFFQEILRLLDNYRHRPSTYHGNVGHSSNTFRIPGFLRFRVPIRLPSLPPAITNTKAYAKVRQCTGIISRALTNTPSMNAERIEEYVTPEGRTWAPHFPGPGMAMELHKTAAMVVFSVIFLPYSFIGSLICSLISIGLRSGFPKQWQFCLYIGLVGWLPTLAFSSIYVLGRHSINQRRKQSWEIWGANAERRIREFEGLHGPERELQERRFFDWMRDGEGVEEWFFEELQTYPRMPADEESAISIAVPGEQWRNMVYSADSGDTTSSGTSSEGTGETESLEAGIRMDVLVPVASEQHAIRVPDESMLELRSMESFDTAALSADRAPHTLPSIDSVANTRC